MRMRIESRAGVESVEIRGTKSVYYRVHLFGNLAFGNMSFFNGYLYSKQKKVIISCMQKVCKLTTKVGNCLFMKINKYTIVEK